MKKSILFAVLFAFSAVCFAQNISTSQDSEVQEEIFPEEIIENAINHRIEWALCFSPMLILNTQDVKLSAPSQIVYPFSLSFIVPAERMISFQPRLSFFSNYMLWMEDAARPAEIENRTATVFNYLLDLPCVYSYKPGKRHTIEAGAGLSLLLRWALLSNGLDDDDYGETGTAGDDVQEINKWFWKDANFMYFFTSVGYLFEFTDKIKAGPEFRFHLPIGSLVTDDGMNNSMFSIGVKVRF